MSWNFFILPSFLTGKFFLEKVLVDNFHFYSSEDVIPLPPTSIVSDATSAVNIVSLGLSCPCHFCIAAFWIFFFVFCYHYFYYNWSSYRFKYTCLIWSFWSFVCMDGCFSSSSVSSLTLSLARLSPYYFFSCLRFLLLSTLSYWSPMSVSLLFRSRVAMCFFFFNVSLLILYLGKHCQYINFIYTWSTVFLWIYFKCWLYFLVWLFLVSFA